MKSVRLVMAQDFTAGWEKETERLLFAIIAKGLEGISSAMSMKSSLLEWIDLKLSECTRPIPALQWELGLGAS